MFILEFIKKNKWLLLGLIVFSILASLSLAPQDFQKNKRITVEDGETIRSVSKKLKQENLIRSATYFNVLLMITGDGVVAGEYLFKDKTNIFVMVRRIAQGDFQIPIRIVTFSEGMTVEEIAERTKYYIPDFDDKKFIELALPKEGYLFPDTYKLKDNIKPEELILMLEENFYKKITTVEEKIKSSKYSLEQIIIMASIVEKEATADTRQEVADVLWKRYEDDFPLQVDATFVYTHGKGTFDLTKSDLRDKDNPYNTYYHAGLIPTPISNPGLDSILAAANPRPTDYYYFLTGRDGEMYFAKTFKEHSSNKVKYLD